MDKKFEYGRLFFKDNQWFFECKGNWGSNMADFGSLDELKSLDYLGGLGFHVCLLYPGDKGYLMEREIPEK